MLLIISTGITFVFITRGYAPYPELQQFCMSRPFATEKFHIWPGHPHPCREVRIESRASDRFNPGPIFGACHHWHSTVECRLESRQMYTTVCMLNSLADLTSRGIDTGRRLVPVLSFLKQCQRNHCNVRRTSQVRPERLSVVERCTLHADGSHGHGAMYNLMKCFFLRSIGIAIRAIRKS